MTSQNITDIAYSSEIFPTYIKNIFRPDLQTFLLIMTYLDVKIQPQLLKNVLNKLCLSENALH